MTTVGFSYSARKFARFPAARKGKLKLGTFAAFPDAPRMSQPAIEVKRIAELARLELTQDEIAKFQPQLEKILGHVETLTALDVSGVEATSYSASIFGRMRDDVPHESLPPEAVLQNAPDQAQGQIRVPKVVADA
ncbi:MAG: Asp-tRNA(Asn)/Glu-tRNA(Gln) amidotransferase subunit GatC [Verrucomicrobiaceae bacterium]|nr:MAG: Asp-tRNA(Asn)/Glu-tRNA(Gln) amidotransferase subunit GatC [Verrucomicrobiaceae bacterium]